MHVDDGEGRPLLTVALMHRVIYDLCVPVRTWQEYVIARVDERHGRVNRSIHILSASSAARVLSHNGYASTALGAPKSERALLRIAIDWCSQPNRSSADIKRVMSEINFTGLPTYTLLFMDRNPHLSGGLLKLFQRSQSGVEAMLKLGLAQQRLETDPDTESEAVTELEAEVNQLATAAGVDVSEYSTTTARPPRFAKELAPGFPSAAELVRIACESAKMKQDALDDVARSRKRWLDERERSEAERDILLAELGLEDACRARRSH